jgi:hypothetical protein
VACLPCPKALAETRGLPSLRSLEFDLADREWGYGGHHRGARDYTWALSAPFAPQLETFGVRSGWQEWPEGELKAWLEMFRARAPLLKKFVMRSTSSHLTISIEHGASAIAFQGDARWADHEREAAQRLCRRAGIELAI